MPKLFKRAAFDVTESIGRCSGNIFVHLKNITGVSLDLERAPEPSTGYSCLHKIRITHFQADTYY
jgi:hypothetical protein